MNDCKITKCKQRMTKIRSIVSAWWVYEEAEVYPLEQGRHPTFPVIERRI